ncbi:MAG: chromate efflux transporter [Gloeomargaritaceae cyanobacterium C42_A2020_066]|nr:chromate efflux transporter [Gloeomargaritaceae cyanobacterium C42_A2020_066]
MTRLRELAQVFLKIGTLGFGGPAAHIALMEKEVVQARQWLTQAEFLDLVGATNLIPGPNSTEMAIHLGLRRAGWPGLAVAGICFILPAVILTTLLAILYQEYGTVPALMPLLTGIKPVVLVIIGEALWRLGKKALKSWRLVPIVVFVVALVLVGVNEVLALLLGGGLGLAWLGMPRLYSMAWPLLAVAAPELGAASAGTAVSLSALGLFFLKIGCVLFGSGYVLVAFVQEDLVNRLGWLTNAQLLDAIAIGQFTPGPVLSTATFIGYLVAGLPGAGVATVGIFLPSFVFVALLSPWVPVLRRSVSAGRFLDAVNAGSIALMAVVTLRLAWNQLLLPLAGLAGLTAAPTDATPLGIFTSWLVLLLSVVAVRLPIKMGTAALVGMGASVGWLGWAAEQWLTT